MSKVRVSNFSISSDGYAAGPDQSREHPLGVGGQMLHQWFYPTRTFQTLFGKGSGTTGEDEEYAARGMENVGAWILGRNMFGPVRGPWPDEQWRGWWGETPPYHTPVFVLTHHARPPLEMNGNTTFYFVTDGMRAALDRAREAAGDKDVRIGGGASVIRQYLEARLIDELHIAVAPVVLGAGEPLLAGINLPGLGYRVARHTNTPAAMHLTITRYD